MQYTYLVATRQNNNGWHVTLRDGEQAKIGPIEGELQRQLTKLHAEGWSFVSMAATDTSLTIILNRASES